MNYKLKISRETSPACNPTELCPFNLHYGIMGWPYTWTKHVNLLSDERLKLNEDKNYGRKNYYAKIPKMGEINGSI